MAVKRKESRVSMGGRQKKMLLKEQRRKEKFARRAAAGKVYEYNPNPFKKGSVEWEEERLARAEKAKSPRDEYSRMKSVMAKLERELEQKRIEMAQKKEKVKNK